MTAPLITKVRAGRRAALASLNARLAQGANVVSMYENQMPARIAVPEFHSVRHHADTAATRPSTLILTNRIAA